MLYHLLCFCSQMIVKISITVPIFDWTNFRQKNPTNWTNCCSGEAAAADFSCMNSSSWYQPAHTLLQSLHLLYTTLSQLWLDNLGCLSVTIEADGFLSVTSLPWPITMQHCIKLNWFPHTYYDCSVHIASAVVLFKTQSDISWASCRSWESSLSVGQHQFQTPHSASVLCLLCMKECFTIDQPLSGHVTFVAFITMPSSQSKACMCCGASLLVPAMLSKSAQSRCHVTTLAIDLHHSATDGTQPAC